MKCLLVMARPSKYIQKKKEELREERKREGIMLLPMKRIHGRKTHFKRMT
jgi:hypothetical protein